MRKRFFDNEKIFEYFWDLTHGSKGSNMVPHLTLSGFLEVVKIRKQATPSLNNKVIARNTFEIVRNTFEILGSKYFTFYW